MKETLTATPKLILKKRDFYFMKINYEFICFDVQCHTLY